MSDFLLDAEAPLCDVLEDVILINFKYIMYNPKYSLNL